MPDAAPPVGLTMVIRQPVRSGQQIYAEKTDLIVRPFMPGFDEERWLAVNNRATLHGLHDIQGYNPVQLQAYVDYMRVLNGTSQDYHDANVLESGLDSPLLDLLMRAQAEHRRHHAPNQVQGCVLLSIKTGGWLDGTSLALPHGLGHGWAAVLWDMAWDLVEKHGFNPNVYEDWDTGGNNRSLQYVTDGLKLQGCGPGLVVSRAAIVAAAEALGGEDTCTVWAAFARRGLGYSAVQGTTDRDDNYVAIKLVHATLVDDPEFLRRVESGALVPPPRVAAALATRRATVSWPPVTASVARALRGSTRVRGPGQKAAASRRASSASRASAIRLLFVASNPGNAMPAALRVELRPPSHPTR